MSWVYINDIALHKNARTYTVEKPLYNVFHYVLSYLVEATNIETKAMK